MKDLEKQYKLKCQNCPYYTGIQCHGHGDYWGSCGLLDMWHKVIKGTLPKHVYSGESMNTILDDDSTCLLQRYELVYIEDLRDNKDK